MRRINVFSNAILLKIIFTFSLFILIFISAVSYKHSLLLVDTTSWVMHSYKINDHLLQLSYVVKEAESGQRGFIISRDSAYLFPYYRAKQKIDEAFVALNNMCKSNAQQFHNLQQLSKLVQSKFSNLDGTLKMNGDDPLHKELLFVNMKLGKGIMDSITFQIDEMIATEMGFLKKRQSTYEEGISFGPFITLLSLLFALLVFIFSYWKISRGWKNLTKANAKLKIINETTRQAEEIGDFSSWEWDMESNEVSYSDNQFLLLGCLPQSFEPSIEKFLEFVHPDDKHIIIDAKKLFLETGSYPGIFFRIIRKDGALRYFKALCKLVVQDDGRKTLVGANKDITEYHLSQVALEERNHELEIRNRELASFNQVASHDLQEPLRIVQTYISRFSEKELSFMSERGREYMAKMKVAVTRMRTLINDLLLFAKVNTRDKIFECSDLNLLLEESKQDMAQVIHENKVSIHAVELPSLKVIPFQIKQLFTNLITNSIKYKRDNVPSTIRITCEKTLTMSYPEFKSDSKKGFYKISVMDNGLGFEQEFADQIFGLFHRLHHEKEYPGTGIGLSICKKIAENHNGFITAEGKPGEGSVFSFFLPL